MTIDAEHFRAELQQHRERLLGTIKHHDIGNSSLTEETGELMSSSADNHLADTASETYEREFDEALARLDAGTYGTCSVCGKEIPVERLEAVPWTTLCIDDARKLQG